MTTRNFTKKSGNHELRIQFVHEIYALSLERLLLIGRVR